MSGHAPDEASRTDDGVTWRQLRRGLWVGRADDHPLGVIEQGRRFTFTGADGTSHPGFATLSDAQDAATGSVRDVASDDRRSGDRGRGGIGLPSRSIALLLLAGAVLAATCGLLFLL